MSDSLDNLLARFDPTLPLERAHTIPSAWYHDPRIAALEKDRIFATTWLLAGRIDQVGKSGDYFTLDLAGEPIVVVRDGENLRGFFNVCRHRGARVACEDQGCATRFRCRYHGWTYDLAGRLRGTPEFDGVADFRREENGLASIAVGEYGPLVWVNLAGNTAPLAEWLAPLERRDTLAGLRRFRWQARREYRLECNWKVYVDNFLDGGYHVNTIHPGLASVLDYSHYRTEIDEHANVQISPMRSGGEEGINQVRSGSDAFYWWVFPNMMLNFYESALDTNLVLPDGPDACRVIFDYYFPEGAGQQGPGYIEQSIAVTDRIQDEDMGICADVQRGLKSRAFDTGRYSVRREIGVYHFHQMLARRLLGS
jgi:choline monooxygenase